MNIAEKIILIIHIYNFDGIRNRVAVNKNKIIAINGDKVEWVKGLMKIDFIYFVYNLYHFLIYFHKFYNALIFSLFSLKQLFCLSQSHIFYTTILYSLSLKLNVVHCQFFLLFYTLLYFCYFGLNFALLHSNILLNIYFIWFDAKCINGRYNYLVFRTLDFLWIGW